MEEFLSLKNKIKPPLNKDLGILLNNKGWKKKNNYIELELDKEEHYQYDLVKELFYKGIKEEEEKENYEINKIVCYFNEDQKQEFDARIKKLSKRLEKDVFKDSYEKSSFPELRKAFHNNFVKYTNEIVDGVRITLSWYFVFY
jgi:hypothetical protein